MGEWRQRNESEVDPYHCDCGLLQIGYHTVTVQYNSLQSDSLLSLLIIDYSVTLSVSVRPPQSEAIVFITSITHSKEQDSYSTYSTYIVFP